MAPTTSKTAETPKKVADSKDSGKDAASKDSKHADRIVALEETLGYNAEGNALRELIAILRDRGALPAEKTDEDDDEGDEGDA